MLSAHCRLSGSIGFETVAAYPLRPARLHYLGNIHLAAAIMWWL